jgi:large subunit ribosomal protein L18
MTTMDRLIHKAKRALRRKHSVRRRVRGTSERPRLTVYRSHQHIYAQVIDDTSGMTLASAGSNDSANKIPYGGNKQAAATIGQRIAQAAKTKGITKVAFDRGPFKYHGRIQELADAARKAGLEF